MVFRERSSFTCEDDSASASISQDQSIGSSAFRPQPQSHMEIISISDGEEDSASSVSRSVEYLVERRKKCDQGTETTSNDSSFASEIAAANAETTCVNTSATAQISHSDSRPRINRTLDAIVKDIWPVSEAWEDESLSMDNRIFKVKSVVQDSARSQEESSSFKEMQNGCNVSELPSGASSMEMGKVDSCSNVATVPSGESVSSSYDEDPEQTFAKKAQERILGLLGAILPQDSKVRDTKYIFDF